MGVKDEFHQKAILVCVDELCQRNGGHTNESSNGSPGNFSADAHRLVESSFPSVERCDKCHKFLRGLLHQGLVCHCKSLIDSYILI